MTQRRMPSGQGPARSGGRWSGGGAARPGGSRGAAGDRSFRVGPSSRPRTPPRPGRAAGGGRPTASATTSSGSWWRAGLKRGAGPAQRIRAPRGPRRLTARAAALGLVLLALIPAYAYPVQTYLDQRATIQRMEAEQRAQEERIRALAERLERWNDRDYVIAQARSRLQWVRPGERTYVVVDEDLQPTGPAPADGDAPWFRQLWDNVQAVDDVPAGP